jgi:hypothetical protein
MSAQIDRNDSITTADSEWRSLYLIGAIATLIVVLIFRRFCGAEMMAFNGFGIFSVPEIMPLRAVEWFELLQENPFIGLVLLNLIDLINYALVGLILIALYGALRNENRIAMGMAAMFGIVGITVYFVSNQALGMLYLSEKYAAAETEARRMIFSAAGEALLSESGADLIHQSTGTYISLFLVLLAGLIISIVMLRSSIFNKATGITGILANGIALVLFIMLILAPEISWIPPTLSAPFRMVWYILIAVQLFKLSKVGR